MKKNKKIAIELKNVCKTYCIRHEKPTLIENVLYRQKNELFQAINGVSLTLFKGDKLGIIGNNGSGKTTLLKLIAGITKQKSGSILIKGKLVSLIDLEAGFHPDLTGEENIFLNGLIVGMSHKEIMQKINDIISFANIGSFINAPLYTYSSGMKLRLGFSIAVHSDPDILLLDEGFAVGDEEFRMKANKKIEGFVKAGKTLVMVSHWMDELKKNCDKFVWLESGKVKACGNTEVIEAYLKSSK